MAINLVLRGAIGILAFVAGLYHLKGFMPATDTIKAEMINFAIFIYFYYVVHVYYEKKKD